MVYYHIPINLHDGPELVYMPIQPAMMCNDWHNLKILLVLAMSRGIPTQQEMGLSLTTVSTSCADQVMFVNSLRSNHSGKH